MEPSEHFARCWSFPGSASLLDRHANMFTAMLVVGLLLRGFVIFVNGLAAYVMPLSSLFAIFGPSRDPRAPPVAFVLPSYRRAPCLSTPCGSSLSGVSLTRPFRDGPRKSPRVGLSVEGPTQPTYDYLKKSKQEFGTIFGKGPFILLKISLIFLDFIR